VSSCSIDQLFDQAAHQRLSPAMGSQRLGTVDELICLIQPSIGQRYFGLSDLEEKHGCTIFCSWRCMV
jgi:hypothetical protein